MYEDTKKTVELLREFAIWFAFVRFAFVVLGNSSAVNISKMAQTGRAHCVERRVFPTNLVNYLA